VAAIVQILSLYVGDNEVARHNRAAGPLLLPEGMGAQLARSLREGVLNRQAGFRGRVEIEGLPPLDLEWVGAAGQTAGVAVWFRGGLVGCASVLLSGLEDARERGEVLAALAARRLPVPPDINDALDKFPRPLLVNVHYSLASQADPVTAPSRRCSPTPSSPCSRSMLRSRRFDVRDAAEASHRMGIVPLGATVGRGAEAVAASVAAAGPGAAFSETDPRLVTMR
jgi:hypothetical protein